MIQRVQTLYLAFAAIIAGVTIYFFGSNFEGSVFSDKEKLTFGVKILLNTSFVLSLVSIFLFNKRLLQMTIGKFNILINLLLMGLTGYLLLNLPGEINFSEKGIEVLASCLASILFLFLANRSIKRDEALVKSVDRLR